MQEDILFNVTPPLIPRKVLFGNPDKANTQISPDGTKISYLAPVKGVLNIWVGSLDNFGVDKPITYNTDQIHSYKWAYTNNHLLYEQNNDGDEKWRIYSVDINTGEIKMLIPEKGTIVQLHQISPQFPDEILVTVNDRNSYFHDLYRVNIKTGISTLVQKNEGFISFITDDDYNVRFAIRMTSDGGTEIVKLTKEGDWMSFMKITMEDSLTTKIVGFNKTGNILYLIDSRHRDTAALYAFNLETNEQTLLAVNAQADVHSVMIHPTEKYIQAVVFMYERIYWQILDNSLKSDFEYLKQVNDGDIQIEARTLDDNYWIVVYIMDTNPPYHYFYDRQAQKAQFLFTTHNTLEDWTLTKRNIAIIKSRDGLNLVSYYSLPVESDSNGDGYPDKPLPTVLIVHGGPWLRDVWRCSPLHQWLTNRGYAVLAVNFRGSSGFGTTFLNASNQQWGGAMHDDLIDAVDWTIQKGIADPAKIAIMGYSYGGYATLLGLTLTPQKFACGIDIVGISSLITQFEAIPPRKKPMIEVFVKRVGDPRTEEGRAFLLKRSPLTYVDRIQRPLLISHGVNDPTVNRKESDQIVYAMQKNNQPVTYVLFPDEGHAPGAYAKPKNNNAFNAVVEAFLSKHLGGQYEPIGEAFKSSSITVTVGAEEIPGVTEAPEELQNSAYT